MAAEKLDKDEMRELLSAIGTPPSAAMVAQTPARAWHTYIMAVMLVVAGCVIVFLYFRQPPLAGSAQGKDAASRSASASAVAGDKAGASAPSGPSVLDASGYVFAMRQATVSSETTGRLAHVYTEEGATVTKGQLLADIDSANVVVQISLAQAELVSARKNLASSQVQRDEAKAKFERTRKLVAQGFLSSQQLDTDRFQLDFLDAQLAARASDIEVAGKRLQIQQQQLTNTRILAPFDGMVIEQPAQVGEIVSPISAGGGFTRTGICTLLDINSLGVQVNVSEQFIGKVHRGQPVKIKVQAYPELMLKGVVSKIMPAASRETAAVKVQIGFIERDPRVLPNMGVNVSFQ